MSWWIWGHVYSFLGAFLVLTTLRSTLHLRAAIALVFWMILAKTIYIFNEIESEGRIMAAGVYVFLCAMLYFVHKSKLFMFLGCLGVSAIIWTVFNVAGPYWYKAGLNILWLAGVTSVWMHIFYSRSSSQ